MMSEDLKRAVVLLLRRDSHGRDNAAARHRARVVIFAGISVIAREMEARSNQQIISNVRVGPTENRHSNATGRACQRASNRTGSQRFEH
jgi:hypothetical protein